METALPRPGSQDKQGPGLLFSELGKAWFCACLSLEERESRADLTREKVHGEGYWQVAERCPVRTGNIPLGVALPMEERRTTASSKAWGLRPKPREVW